LAGQREEVIDDLKSERYVTRTTACSLYSPISFGHFLSSISPEASNIFHKKAMLSQGNRAMALQILFDNESAGSLLQLLHQHQQWFYDNAH